MKETMAPSRLRDRNKLPGYIEIFESLIQNKLQISFGAINSPLKSLDANVKKFLLSKGGLHLKRSAAAQGG